MHVILNTSNRDCVESLLLRNACHVGPKLGLEFLKNDFCAALGAENYVHAIAGI
jgi:hypothetical protein